MTNNFSAIIVAAGSGKRMKLPYNKVLHKIDHETIIEKTINIFIQNDRIKQVILVCSEVDYDKMQELFKDYNIEIVLGSSERYLSVYNGLQLVNQENVLIHDGARCFLSTKLLNKYLDNLSVNEACFLAVPSKDTIHLINNNGYVQEPLNREFTYMAQTPQGAKTNILLLAYQNLFADDKGKINITDEVSLLNAYLDIPIKVVESSYDNIKITTIEDLK